MAVTDQHATRWDREAIVQGIGVCLLLAVPLTLIASFVDSDSSGINALFFFGAMGGFVLGSGCAAWIQRRRTPLSHAVATAVIAYAGAQAVFVVIRLLRGGAVNWFGVFFTLSLVMVASIIGGVLGSRLQSMGFVPSNRSSNRSSSSGGAA